MARLFDKGFESGDTSEFDWVDGTVTVNAESKIVGNYGASVAVSSSNDVGVNLASAKTHLWVRFYINTNSVSMAQYAGVRVLMAKSASWSYSFSCLLRKDTGADYILQSAFNDDSSGTVETDWTVNLTDGAHYVEIEWQASSAIGANDGMAKLYIDGTLRQTVTGLDNDTLDIQHVQLGAMDEWGTVSGNILIDGLAIDDSAYIGEEEVNTVYRGVALSGMEFAPTTFPGTQGTDYTENSEACYTYFQGKGFKIVRLPFLWERVQPTVGGALDATYLGYIRDNVAWAAAHGFKIILSCHNFGRRDVSGTSRIIGSAELTIAHFADLWDRLSEEFKDGSIVIGYDLMNEPHDMTVPTTTSNYTSGATATDMFQAAVTAIRANNDNHYCIVELDAWGGVQNFTDIYGSNPTPWITDALDRTIYSGHYYCDDNHCGSYADAFASTNNTNITNDVTAFFAWCQNRGVKCLLGEYGVPNTSDWQVCLTTLLSLCNTYNVWATQWAAGDWYGSPTTLEPTSSHTVDRLQMTEIVKYLSYLSVLITDSAAGSDSVSIVVTVGVTDSGAGADTVSEQTTVSVADGPMTVNLVGNGDLNLHPVSSVPMTGIVDGSFVNGTANGGLTDPGYGWRVGNSGSWAVEYKQDDPIYGHTIKLSTTGVNSYLQVRSDGASGYYGTYGFDVLPKMRYKLSYKMKTTYHSGDSAAGAGAIIMASNANGTADVSASGMTVKVTSDWTYYEATITTGANAAHAHIELRIYGHNGAATLIMDAEYAEIKCSPVFSGSDAVAITSAGKVTDSGLATDTISETIVVPIVDSASGTDSLNIGSTVMLQDSGHASEVIAITAAILLSDNGSATEILQRLVTAALTDSGHGTDSVGVHSALAINDSGSGNDNVLTSASAYITDNFSGDDAVAVLAAVGVSDSAIGEEILQIVAEVMVEDSGVGVDSIEKTIKVLIEVFDSGGSIDEAITVAREMIVSDSGVGTDTIFSRNMIEMVAYILSSLNYNTKIRDATSPDIKIKSTNQTNAKIISTEN